MAVVVEKMWWNRTYLYVQYRATEGHELLMYRAKTQTFMGFDFQSEEDGLITARINVIMAAGREPLDPGNWILCVRMDPSCLTSYETLLEKLPYMKGRMRKHISDNAPLSKREKDSYIKPRMKTEGFQSIVDNPYDTEPVDYADGVLLHTEDMVRVFRYGGAKYAYTASVIPRASMTDKPYLILAMDFFIKNYHPRRRTRSLRYLEKKVFAAAYRVMNAVRPKKGNTVLFFKENGDAPSDNMEAVRDRMIERGLDKQYRIKEHYRNTFGLVRQSPLSWFGDMWALAEADYVFLDDYTPIFGFIDLDKRVTLTQIWHAGVGFKSVGYARFGIEGSPDPFASSHRKYTYALVGNEHLREIYSEVFGIEEEALLATGMPRLDHFLDPEVEQAAKAEMYEKYPWMQNGRVIIFAPTFRGTGQKVAYYPYDAFIDMKRLYEMCEKTNTYFVFEMHHFIRQAPKIPKEYRDRLFDLSNERLSKLNYVADVLVTDYSSCFYDYLLLNRPVVFYVPDKVSYSAIRGVQRSVDELAPGVVCDTFDQFMETLEQSSYNAVTPHPSSLDRCLEQSGLATDRVIDTILLGKDVPGVKKGGC